MTLKECYMSIGGDYEDVVRCLKKESMIERLLYMMLEDQNMDMLRQALAEKDYETAFRAAHTLKGIMLNLRITRLSGTVCELTEALRGSGEKDDREITLLYQKLDFDYQEMITGIRELQKGTQQQGGVSTDGQTQ